MVLYSIGHGARSLAVFLELVQRHELRGIVDVRSFPGSRFHPQYNGKALQASLESIGIAYYFLGASLGGRPKDSALLDSSGKPDYDAMAKASRYLDGLKELLHINDSSGPVAMMCWERDPRDCHRSKLIGASLLEQGIDVVHIEAQGGIILQSQLSGGSPRLLFDVQ
jgi:uncharacterized protein (DUF488 family)